VAFVNGMRVDRSFETFVEEHSAGLLRAAFLLTLDRGYAEDLLQTALLRTARRWGTARAAPVAYVRKVLLNLSHDRRRAIGRRPAELPIMDDLASAGVTDGPAEPVAERRVVVAALAALPMAQRRVVVLRFFEDLTVAETARLLEISEGTVKSYTVRALARLRELLTDADSSSDTTEVTHAHR